jgi:hypothetical protein
MMWILRALLSLPALIATGVAYETLDPIVAGVSVILIIGFATILAMSTAPARPRSKLMLLR